MRRRPKARTLADSSGKVPVLQSYGSIPAISGQRTGRIRRLHNLLQTRYVRTQWSIYLAGDTYLHTRRWSIPPWYVCKPGVFACLRQPHTALVPTYLDRMETLPTRHPCQFGDYPCCDFGNHLRTRLSCENYVRRLCGSTWNGHAAD